MRTPFLTALMAFAMVVSACSSDVDSSTALTSFAASDAGATSVSSTAVSSAAPPSPNADPATTTVNAADTRPPPQCTVLSDSAVGTETQAWQVVNDDVMGGQSEGELAYVEGRLVFAGVINTNGGGFSSLRLPVELGSLASARSIMMRAIGDGRSYMLTLDDQLQGRNQRVSHRADIDLPVSANGTEASVVTIPVADFAPAIFGQPVDDVAVQVEVVDEIGLMISDGLDGPFRLEVEWLAGCP